jgi:hypothetical protein
MPEDFLIEICRTMRALTALVEQQIAQRQEGELFRDIPITQIDGEARTVPVLRVQPKALG